MLTLNEIICLLGYSDSSQFFRENPPDDPYLSGLHQTATNAASNLSPKPVIEGLYYFETQAPDLDGANKTGRLRPAVCVAEAATKDIARQLHRRLWNLGTVPFIIIRLPNEIQLYSGFKYDREHDEPFKILHSNDETQTYLTILNAETIDSGRIWRTPLADELSARDRVDTSLLNNLNALSKVLRKIIHPVLPASAAHALIGKYIYLRFLKDRRILTDNWIRDEAGLSSLEDVFGRNASRNKLRKLVNALEDKFNGGVFKLDYTKIQDKHVRIVASVFSGDELLSSNHTLVRQLSLNFQIYHFEYIPVELLSSIYEQFLHADKKGREKGAYYTPEPLADYLLFEMNTVKPLRPGMTVFDPACGSGIFLVLAYRRLVELKKKELGRSLRAAELRNILVESIFGVERESEACNVAAFSLLLAMWHYIDPPELERMHWKFQFPNLLETNLCQSDFFEQYTRFRREGRKFDWVVGNPPWVEDKSATNPDSNDQKVFAHWRSEPKNRVHTPGKKVQLGFAWETLNFVAQNGVIGLVMPAPDLFNSESAGFRRSFFTATTFRRITNFANIRGSLFTRKQTRHKHLDDEGDSSNASMPASTWVFQPVREDVREPDIVHAAPLVVNQHALSGHGKSHLWSITIYGGDICYVPAKEAATGEAHVWKLAQWGTRRDAWALRRLNQLYPTTLSKYCESQDWLKPYKEENARLQFPVEGPQIKNDPGKNNENAYLREYIGKKRVVAQLLGDEKKHKGQRFTISENTLETITEKNCYFRRKGGLEASYPPHLYFSYYWKDFMIYSDEFFVIPPRRFGIACPPEDAEKLRALAVYLWSSLADYFIFFNTPQWGVYSTKRQVNVSQVRKIPVPDFSSEQISVLANLHSEIVAGELDRVKKFSLEAEDSGWEKRRQKRIDKAVFALVKPPHQLQMLVEDFIEYRLPLDEGKRYAKRLCGQPTKKELLSYGKELRNELDVFIENEVRHKIDFTVSEDWIYCRITQEDRLNAVSATQFGYAKADGGTTALLGKIRQLAGQELSGRFFLQREVIIVETKALHLFKAARRMDWTRASALSDADNLIAHAIEKSHQAA